MTLTREIIVKIREEVNVALNEIAAKNEVRLQVTTARYIGDVATFKLELQAKDAAGKLVTRELQSLKMYGSRYDLKYEHAGVEFYHGGEKFKFTGLNPKARKYPLVAARLSDEKSFRFGTSYAEVIRQAYRCAA